MDTDKRLERVAEELMGRRKWKQYQDSLNQSRVKDLSTQQSHSIEDQKNSNKLQETETKTGIKTETVYIKEDTQLKTVDDVGKKLAEDEEEHKAEKDLNHIRVKSELSSFSSSSSSSSSSIGNLATLDKPEPIDWKPQDKCYFCVDGNLLKVNEVGELVAELGSVRPEIELNKHIVESDDSSSSSDEAAKTPQLPPVPKFEAFLKSIAGDSSMTSFDLAAAQIAAFQRIPELNQLNPFYSNAFFQQLQQQMSPSTPPDRTSPSIKPLSCVDLPMASPSNHSGEQPLDLSAKPSGSLVDSKNIFKAKPRISTVPGRRSYTEEELNNALQDILSGKLGTRRAAVIYGIPRSTLRNKVYKLALEQKRELLANNPPLAVLEGDDDDKDSEPEDDKSVTKTSSSDQLQAYLKLFENASQSSTKAESKANNWPLDPNTLLQSLLLANAGGLGGLGGFPPLFPSTTKGELPDFLRKLLTQPPVELKTSDSGKPENASPSSNGVSSPIDRLSMLNLFQQQYNNNKKQGSTTPDLDLDGGSDDSIANSSILKVPSVKSLFGSSGQNHKNGDTSHSTPSTSPQIATSPHGSNHMANLRSPQNMRCNRSESSSPPTARFNLHDVIRESISKNFQSSESSKHSTPLMIDPMDTYNNKKPYISVIKNLGGTDISRFGSNPNITQLTPQPLSPNNTGTGGKGTRPKRGKYRNYDRDSLVEAVKAVQRGEMSVHRAGSYYGVPHSTLEYKVKERHLMRPRKREPKPQPLDSSTTSSSSKISSDMGGLRTIEKNKTISANKTPVKMPYAANGLKMPPFLDPTMAAQLQYTQQLFWQHGNFPAMTGMDFSRGSSQNNSTPFPPNSDNFFTQQMLQKIQEEQHQQLRSPVNGNNSSTSGSSKRETEHIFDAVGTNGSSSSSFLDNIIRHSLDKKPSEQNSTLFEQLLKNTKNSIMSSGGSSEDNGYAMHSPKSKKRSGSPFDFGKHSEIKRERASPSTNETNTDYLNILESQQLMSLRENLGLKEEINGSLKNDLSNTNS